MATSRFTCLIIIVAVASVSVGVLGERPLERGSSALKKTTAVPPAGRPSLLALAFWFANGAVLDRESRVPYSFLMLYLKGYPLHPRVVSDCIRHTMLSGSKAGVLSSAAIRAGGYLLYNRVRSKTRSRLVGLLAGLSSTSAAYFLRQLVLPKSMAFEKVFPAFEHAGNVDKLADIIDSFFPESYHEGWIDGLKDQGRAHVFLNKFGCTPKLTSDPSLGALMSCKAKVQESYGSVALSQTKRVLYERFLKLVHELIDVKECDTATSLQDLAKVAERKNDAVNNWFAKLKDRNEEYRFLNLFEPRNRDTPKLTALSTVAEIKTYRREVLLRYHPDKQAAGGAARLTDVDADVFKKFKELADGAMANAARQASVWGSWYRRLFRAGGRRANRNAREPLRRILAH